MAVKAEFLETIKNNAVVIVKAETGSGKSTCLAAWLAEAGYNAVNGQPRRLPAEELAAYNARIAGCELGEEVGFRHLLAQAYSDATTQTFATYGNEYMHHLARPMAEGTVIIIDEFHERNAYSDLMLALLHQRWQAGYPIKLVIASATIETEAVSSYFGGAPVIDVPGRTFEVVDQAPANTTAEDAHLCALRGLKSLTFLYGKKDINNETDQLGDLGVTAEIRPLHSGLSSAEQQKAFKDYPKGRIILATPIAETSLTIPDLDVVIISGWKRRSTLTDGVPTLTLEQISQFEHRQQRGRVGRTKPGVCISHVDPATLKKEAPPEIQHIALEAHALRLLSYGKPLRHLNSHLLNPASEEQLFRADRANYQLGLIGPKGHITDLGLRVAKLPVDVRQGKMLRKAEERVEELGSVAIVAATIDVAAVWTAEGVLSDDHEKDDWRGLLNGLHCSDAIAHMILFQKALDMTSERRVELGLDEVKLNRALELRAVLRRRMDIAPDFEIPERLSRDELRALEECIWAGSIDQLFRRIGDDRYGNALYRPIAGGDSRVLSRSSVVFDADIVVGDPINIEYMSKSGSIDTSRLLFMASAVDQAWLAAHTPPQLKSEIDDALKSVRTHEAYNKEQVRRRTNKVIRPNPFRNRGRRG
jgi:HrpA-like RNA helicase